MEVFSSWAFFAIGGVFLVALIVLLVMLRKTSPDQRGRGLPPAGFRRDLPSSKHGERWASRQQEDDDRLKQPDGVVE